MISVPTRWATAVFVSFLCLAAGGCPPATPDPSNGPNDTTGDGLSGDLRMQVLDQVDQIVAGVTETDYGAQNRQIVEQLKALPEIADADTDESGAIWAHFTDGRLLGVYNDPDEDLLPPVTDDDLTKIGLTQKLRFAEPQSKDDANAKNIPPAAAQIISGLHGDRRTAVPVLQQLFSEAGYELAADGPKPTAEQWLSLDTAGFYYFEGHGTYFLNSATGQREFAFITDIPVNLDNELILKQDLLDGAAYPIVNSHGHHKYAITRLFIQKHVVFPEESVVWFGACCGGSTIASSFINTCFASGAGIYIGWDATVKNIDAEAAAYYVVNHTLGLNADINFTTSEGTIQFIPAPPDPPQRPFSYASAFGAKAPTKPNQFPFTLTTGGLPYNVSIGLSCETDGCTQIQSNLVAYKNPNLPDDRFDFILAPSIQRMEINERDAELTLYGIFDNDGFQRKVVVGDQQFLDAEWGQDKIVIKNFPTDAFGEVRVVHTKFLGGDLVRSNPRWLTRISNVNFTVDKKECTNPQPGQKHCGEDAVKSCNRYERSTFENLTFRADVGFGRAVPFSDPYFQGDNQKFRYAVPDDPSYTFEAGGSDDAENNLTRKLESNGGTAEYAMPETAFIGVGSGVQENEFTCYFGVTTDSSFTDRRIYFEPSVWIPDNLVFINSYPCASPSIDDIVSGVVDVGCDSCVFGNPSDTVHGNWNFSLNNGAGWSAVSGTYDDGADLTEYSATAPKIEGWPDDHAPQ